jgi:2',3'-cyclic-nucleotide 2'-phosphodiesterase (5'-nucleotidase family)
VYQGFRVRVPADPASRAIPMIPRSRLVPAVLLCLAACAGGPVPGATPSPAGGTLVLMGTTDLHGWILPHDYYTGEATPNGLAALVPVIDSVRAAHPGRTVLVESGDILQGNPLAFVHSTLRDGERHPVVAAMELAGYDAAAIGNHEFNYGIEHLERSVAAGRVPFLSANVFRAGTDEHAFPASLIVERAVAGRPLRIGITAVTPPGVALWDRQIVEGRLEFREIVSSLRPVVADLRRRGADVVLVASHGGLEGSSYDTAATGLPAENAVDAIARGIPGIDVVLMGHTHREVADTVVAGVLIQQAGNWAASLAVAELEMAWADGRWRVAGRRGTLLRPEPGRSDPRIEAAAAEAHARTLAYVGEVIGTSTEEWRSALSRTRPTPIIDLIHAVQLRVTGADLSAASAFTLDARIPAGPVTVADVAGLYVYDNTLKAVRITGAQLRAYLERSAEYFLPCPGGACERLVNPAHRGYDFDMVAGVDYTLDLTRPVGVRLVRLERGGRPVRDDDVFTLAINSYRAAGSGGYDMLAGAPVVHDRGEGIRELLIEEVRRRGVLRAEDVSLASWSIVPEHLAERAAAEMRAAGLR